MAGKSKKKKKTIDDYKKENIFLKGAIARFCKDCVTPMYTKNMKCNDESCPLYPYSPIRDKEFPFN